MMLQNQNTFPDQLDMTSMTELPKNPDFFILAIIDKEFEAIMRTLSLEGPVQHNGRNYYYGTISGPENKSYSVVCSQSYDPGNTSSAIVTTEVLQNFTPKYFLLVGIAGGVKGRKDLALGDVVVSTLVQYYELKKVSEGKTHDIPRTLANPSRYLLNTCRELRTEKWENDIQEKRPDDEGGSPKALSGLILSGEKLLGDEKSSLLKQLLEDYPKALAVEMEGAGVAGAIYDASSHTKTEFLAIRGVSDFCNDSNGENQKTRKLWRGYASSSAATFAKKLMGKTIIDPDETTAPREKYIAMFDGALISGHDTEFNRKIKTAEDTKEADSLHELIKNNRKVLLKGAAGAGKSELITRLPTYQIDDDIVPVLVNLQFWNSTLTDAIMGSTDTKEKINILLKSSHITPNIEQIESFNKPYCLIIDGLNQISGGDYGDEIPSTIVVTVENYLQDHAGATALITDRLATREFFSTWKEAELLPIATDEVKSVVDVTFGTDTYDGLSGGNKEILDSAYFLNLALEIKSPQMSSKIESISKFFQYVLKIDGEKLDKMSEVIFHATKKNGEPSFQLDDIKEIGDELIDVLRSSGVLGKGPDNKFTFDHQLKHEFLCARFLSSHPDVWGHESFDAVTLNSNSPDSIYMTFAQISDTKLSDLFLLSVYDWNWNVAIKSISSNLKLNVHNHSDEIVKAILLLVSMKKFDPVHNTAKTAEKNLANSDPTLAQPFTDANSLKEIIALAKGITQKYDWMEKWMYIIGKEDNINEDDILLINSKNSIIGWTTSNVLRERKLDESDQMQLRTVYYSSDSTTSEHNTRRWRVVHVLGKQSSAKNTDLLFNALENDPYHWVRYGAARSLVEMAARTDNAELRKSILGKLSSMLEILKLNVLDEIGKTSFYKNAFDSWKEDVSPLLKQAMKLYDNESHKAKWAKRIQDFEGGEWKNN